MKLTKEACYFTQQQQIESLEEIDNKALKVIDEKYGRGYPLWDSGEHDLAFHNGQHGRMVGRGALKLCTYLGLPEVEQKVGAAAGSAHDIVQLKGSGTNEQESVDWIVAEMEKRSFLPPHLRTMAGLAILGTEPIFENGAIVGQRASTQDYPDKATELVAKSVASADLGVLYTPEGPYFSHQLLRELNGMPTENELPLDKLIEFQRGNVQLTECYRYPLEEAEQVLATHRPQVIDFHHGLLGELESGNITTWGELLRRDEEFILQHRQ